MSHAVLQQFDNVQSSQQPHKIRAMIISILQIDTLRYREVKPLTQVPQPVSAEVRIMSWTLTYSTTLPLTGWMSQSLSLGFRHILCFFLG